MGNALAGFGVGVVFDLGAGRVRLDCLNALLGTCLRLVTLAGGDDLAVRGLEVEAELARVILADLKFGGHASPSGSGLLSTTLAMTTGGRRGSSEVQRRGG
jgi:hypothetical protein